MKAFTQADAIGLISRLNLFADNAEQLIQNTQTAYDRGKANLQRQQQSTLDELKRNFQNRSAAVQRKGEETIRDAYQIQSEIAKMDINLTSVDKYYVKTVKRKKDILAGQTSSKYSDTEDYFAAIDQIKSDFNALYTKYSQEMLPGILNGINYVFSSKRKQDYEDLILLRNTVDVFIKDVMRELQPIISEYLDSLESDYKSQKKEIESRQSRERNVFEMNHASELDRVADKIWQDLDEILPDAQVSYLSDLTASYLSNFHRVNPASEVPDEVTAMMFLDYPVDFFVQSPIVASVIREKCAGLITGGVIRFPIIKSFSDTPVWMICCDNSGATPVQKFTHALMFAMLSAIPVAGLKYSIIDPENHGNSVAPFFDARKKLPELFGEKLYVSREEISSKLVSVSQFIQNVQQNKLGNRYEHIFDYARDHEEYHARAELLVLYDYPQGLDDRTLRELKNILRNGSRCGIYVLIVKSPVAEASGSAEHKRNLKEIEDLSTAIVQNDRRFTMFGLTLSYPEMPEQTEFNRFFGKYMLIFEGIRNRGIAFSPLIKRLADAADSLELDAQISYICLMMKEYEKNYALVPGTDSKFPSLITLGTVLYPADIFSDSKGYGKIVDKFAAAPFGEEEQGYVELPLTLDFGSSFNLFLHCSDETSQKVSCFTHHVIWDFLSFLPVTKANICVFDEKQHGNSILPFLDFRKRCPDVFDQKIYTGQEDMRAKLQQINVQIDEFIQDKLGNRFENILDYNRNTPRRPEAVTLLVVYDFPSGMDSRSIDLLTNILRNGNKCGVFTVICYNPEVNISRYDSIDDRLDGITRYCTSMEYRDGHYSLLPFGLEVKIPAAPGHAAIDAFISDYADKSERIKSRGLAFKDILDKDLFSCRSAKSLSIPIGIGDGDSVISLKMGEGSSHHGLIAGATGSGKSTLLHTLIMSSMLHYSPEELHLYLMDFKSGTEFKIYESVRLPHIQLLALDAMQEFGESILENLVKEMERRGKRFKAVGQSNLKDYTEETGEALPRILVIMDEFQILFNDSANRKVAMNCAELAKRIVTEGRSYGIHLLMATQSTRIITGLTIAGGTVEQMRIRIGLKCSENDARYMFGENDSDALKLMKGPKGTAVMNPDFTEQPNIGFRVAYCDPETQRQYLQVISEQFKDSPYNLQVFEGGRTEQLLDHYRQEGIGKTDQSLVQIHMGTLIKVAPPFILEIDRKKKNNLLVCGANDNHMGDMVFNNFLIGAILNKNAQILCMDGDMLVGEEESEAFYRTLSVFSPRFRMAKSRGDIIRAIREVYQIYLERKKHNSHETVFVAIKNFQYMDILQAMLKNERIDESEYLDEDEEKTEEQIRPGDADEAKPSGDSEDKPASGNLPPQVAELFAVMAKRDRERQEKERRLAGTGAQQKAAATGKSDGLSTGDKLVKLINDGSGFGIHFIITSTEYQIVKETMRYGANILDRIPERIVFSLGSADAVNLIDSVSVDNLTENTVYYSDRVKNTFQLKPYISPDANELRRFLSGFDK